MDRNSGSGWIERAIQDARDRGLFDNLEGEGRPINWADESLVDEEWITAFRPMREHGFAPEWIELQKDIRIELDKARNAVSTAWLWRRDRIAQTRELQRSTIESEWRRARVQFAEAVSELNSRIADFNLIVPLVHLQKPMIDVEQELAGLGIDV